MSLDELRAAYTDLRSEADRLAGNLLDIRRRAMILHNLYVDSGRNHAFPVIAAHGALWAFRYFEVGGRLGRFVSYRYFYSTPERMHRLGLLNSYAEAFRRINRLVCIDTYTNFRFTDRFGDRAGAEEFVHPELLEALNRVHAARNAGRRLNEDETRNVFQMSFKWEQELTVAPGVAEAVAGFDCPILRGLCLKPLVRFAFFPRWRFMRFRNFSNKDERIEKGQLTYDLARRAGWEHVADSLRAYRLLDPQFFAAPREHLQDLIAAR